MRRLTTDRYIEPRRVLLAESPLTVWVFLVGLAAALAVTVALAVRGSLAARART